MIECEFQKNVPVPDGGSSAPCSYTLEEQHTTSANRKIFRRYFIVIYLIFNYIFISVSNIFLVS